ncbi:uncharacterized protein LOC111299792 [Durio zibethinus]|uniref:Uncharacterized protein LOC111299792 n=1 Tax=Durio zibethinus TaxID=66656 RepID=A0A6P5ZF51_DURZI|nr:uncharacterized protein LOC111299792 [Durio zibethinus]
MAKPSATNEERSHQEQPRSNPMCRPSVLPDLNSLFLPSQHPTNRPDEDALIPNDLPDSITISDEEVDEGYGDDEYYEDEDEEIRRVILQIRKELEALQQKLGSVLQPSS